MLVSHRSKRVAAVFGVRLQTSGPIERSTRERERARGTAYYVAVVVVFVVVVGVGVVVVVVVVVVVILFVVVVIVGRCRSRRRQQFHVVGERCAMATTIFTARVHEREHKRLQDSGVLPSSNIST